MQEACALLSKYQQQAIVIAGGTDLLVQMKHKEVLPRYIINISDIRGQDYILYDEEQGVRIGAMATIRSIEVSPLVREKFSLLAEAANMLGSVPVRNRATIAGNLCNAAPSADMAPPLIVLGARAKIMGTDGERTIPIENLWIGPGQTVIKPDEIFAEIQVPDLAYSSGGVYIKHTTRKAMDLAIVGVAIVVTMDSDVIHDIKISLGAVAPTPIRAKKAEGILVGNKINDDLLQKAGQTASDESSCIDDIRSSADNRRRIIKVLLVRAVKDAITRAGGK